MFRFAALLLATPLASANSWSDETTLMQSLKPNTVKKRGPDAIANLLSTATSVLKNGATPDVVQFAQATLDELTATVLPAIQNSHNSDQQLIHETFSMFESTMQKLETEMNEVKLLHDEERGLSQLHKICRNDQEQPICESKQECDRDLYETWLHFKTQESDLRQLSLEVTNHFCVEDANGTAQLFRDRSVVLFPPWLEQKPIVEHWESEYTRKVPTCTDLFSRLDDKTAECDSIQAQLEAAACAHANEVKNVRIRFAREWQYSVIGYQRTVDEVHCVEIDRWKEWRALSTIQCLLTRTNQRNGVPCDESTDEVRGELSACEEVQNDVDIDHLRIEFPEIPSFPPLCAMPPWEGEHAEPAYHDGFWPGRCVPQDPKVPCSVEYTTQEYGDLWAPPVPEFTHENSHCNERAACQTCEVVVEPHWCICLYLFAYGQTNGYWVQYPWQESDRCHEATVEQLESGVYSRVYIGDGQWHLSNGALTMLELESSESCAASER